MLHTCVCFLFHTYLSFRPRAIFCDMMLHEASYVCLMLNAIMDIWLFISVYRFHFCCMSTKYDSIMSQGGLVANDLKWGEILQSFISSRDKPCKNENTQENQATMGQLSGRKERAFTADVR